MILFSSRISEKHISEYPRKDLIFPLPVHSPDDPRAWENATDRNLLGLATRLEQDPLAADGGDPVEPVPQMVLVPVVADRAEVVVGALRALPVREARHCWRRNTSNHECGNNNDEVEQTCVNNSVQGVSKIAYLGGDEMKNCQEKGFIHKYVHLGGLKFL